SAWSLLLGAGVFCIWWSFWPREVHARHTESVGRRLSDRLGDDIAQSGIGSLTAGRLVAIAVVVGLVVFAASMAATDVPAISLIFGGIAGYAPIALVRSRARRRRRQLRDVWPDVVDHIASAVRAGLALPESLAQLAV